MAIDTATITSNAHIYVTAVETIQSNAHIYKTGVTTITSGTYVILDIAPKKIQSTMKNTENSSQSGGTGDGGFRVL